VAVVVSRYNASITDRLLAGARDAWAEAGWGGQVEAMTVIAAPGAYELPALAIAAAGTGRFRGVLALGCLIKGATSHDRYIAEAVAQGLVNVTIATGVPCAFGVLTVDTAEQADERAGGSEGNKGADAMLALLDTIVQIDLLRGQGNAGRGKRLSAGPGRSIRDKAKGLRTGGRGSR
jgi:6,7-dimethyl-8-ribityllumazine synthase